MNRTVQGNTLLVAALAMLLGSLGPEIAGLASFADMLTPAFVGKFFVHVGSVIAAYLAGQVKETSEKTLQVVDAITEKTGT